MEWTSRAGSATDLRFRTLSLFVSFLIDLSVAWQIIKKVCEFTELEFKYLNELMGNSLLIWLTHWLHYLHVKY